MNTTKRKITTALLTAMLMALALGLTAFADKDQNLTTFENGLAPFKPSALNGSDVTAKTLTLMYEKANIVGDSSTGKLNAFAALSTETGAPVWMQMSMPANLESDGSTVAVQFKARDVANCGGCITLVYAGYQRPTSLMDFATDFQSLDSAWAGHQYLITLPSNGLGPQALDTIYVAIGFTHLDDKYTAPSQIIGVDDVSVRLQQILPPPAPIANQ